MTDFRMELRAEISAFPRLRHGQASLKKGRKNLVPKNNYDFRRFWSIKGHLVKLSLNLKIEIGEKASNNA